MKATGEERAAACRNLDDAELLQRHGSGRLAGPERALVEEELRRRGIRPPPAPRRPAPRRLAPGEDVRFETVARSLVPAEMQILRARLEADGIPVLLADENINQVHSLLCVATGGVRLQVPQACAEEARRIIAEVAAGRMALDEAAPEEGDAPPSAVPAWETAVIFAVVVYACLLAYRAFWFTREYGEAIELAQGALLALAFPLAFFAGALLLAVRSRWCFPVFAAHFVAALALHFLFGYQNPILVGSPLGWGMEAAILVFCARLLAAGRLQ